VFTNERASQLSAKTKHLILICGRYEGIDARVVKILNAKRVSVGPYVLTGGELPALIVIDSVARQIKGVLGNFDSREEARVSSHDVYTRPEKLKWKGKTYTVPPILKSGNHKQIDSWKEAQK
jgi:tRNA (guanine37-N1)-methyltransferase